MSGTAASLLVLLRYVMARPARCEVCGRELATRYDAALDLRMCDTHDREMAA